MKNIIVCGSRFGQFYIEALKRIEKINIVGILAKGSNRSRDCAEYYNLPLYTSIDEINEKVDAACVAVKTGTLGGEGAIIAKQLLDNKINVLLEQPVHYKELGECYKVAKNRKVYFGVGNLYLNLPAVHNFIQNVRMISKDEKILYINVDLATQVSYPVISILGEVLPTLRPWESIGKVDGPIPFQSEIVRFGEIPVNFRAHNEIEKTNIDGFLHMLFQISVGFPSGRLTLCDPHGPVIWNPRIHFPDENIIPGRLNSSKFSYLDELNSNILYNCEKTHKEIFEVEWPCAIAEDIKNTLRASLKNDNMKVQKLLNNSQAWQVLMKGLGYPEIVSGSKYTYYPAERFNKQKDFELNKRISLVGGMAIFNVICMKTMYYYLQRNISENNRGYTRDELEKCVGARKEFYPIMKRWIKLLSLNNYIRNEGQMYFFDHEMNYLDLERIWTEGKENWIAERLGALSTYEYFRNNALRLNDIMSGSLNPTLLLFPEGKMHVAEDLYSKTPISIYYNRVISEYVQKECEKRDKCKVLELGGGTASTTKPVIEKIEKFNVDKYYFTDVSDFFVNHAKKIFNQIEFMEFLKLDIDSNFANDKIQENNIDIVVAVGVLNNAYNMRKTLKSIRKILKDDGVVFIVEAIGESVQMLISQAFMMKTSNDERADKNETFLKLNQWYDLFRRTGFTVQECLPRSDSELSVYNQKLFILKCQTEDEYNGSK